MRGNHAWENLRFPVGPFHVTPLRVAHPCCASSNSSGRRGFTRQRAQTCTFEGPDLLTPPKFNEKTSREKQKERKWGRERQKTQNFPTHRGPHFYWVWWSTLQGRTDCETTETQILAKNGLAPKWIGPKWSNKDWPKTDWPKTVSASQRGRR